MIHVFIVHCTTRKENGNMKKFFRMMKKSGAGRRKRNIFRVSLAVVLPVLLLASSGVHSTIQKNHIKKYILRYNPSMDALELDTLVEVIEEESRNLDMRDMEVDNQKVNPAHLLLSFITVESQFTKNAVSRMGARGYMQIMENTASWMNQKYSLGLDTKDLFHTYTNIRLGVVYLNDLAGQMTSVEEVAMAYNAGPGAVRRGFRTESYWEKIRTSYSEISHDF